MSQRIPVFLYLIIGLAIVGLVASLLKNPGSFLISVLISVAIGFVIFMIVRAVLNRRGQGTSDEMRKYKQAAKQSNMKYNKQQENVKRQSKKESPLKPRRRRRRHAPHLRVIHGKKSTTDNNDRASN